MSLLDPTPPRRVTLELPHGDMVAAEVIDGSGPAIVWLPGYGADMTGTKASFLAEQCGLWSHRFIRFDYRGTGQSSSHVEDNTLSRHLEDLEAVIDQLTDQPVILAGSSMGGWLALRYLTLHPEKVAALLGVAVAPDFTLYLEGDKDYNIPAVFVADAKQHLLNDAAILCSGPAIFVHGLSDTVAPYQLSLKAADMVCTDAAEVVLVKGAGHDLNRPQDLRLLWQMLTRLREQVMPAEA